MKTLMVISFLILAQAFAFNVVCAQQPEVVVSDKPGWHKIGAVDTNLGENNKSIAVVGADQFKAIKIKVVDAPSSLRIEKATIVYESNNSQDITINHQFA